MNAAPFSLLDQHLARFLTRESGLTGTTADSFRLLMARLSAALFAGDSCLLITDEEEMLVRASNDLVSDTDRTPLVIWRGRLYLQRYFRYEMRLARQLTTLSTARIKPLPRPSPKGTAFGAPPKGTLPQGHFLRGAFGAPPKGTSFGAPAACSAENPSQATALESVLPLGSMESTALHDIVTACFGPDPENLQRQAAEMALTHPLTLISGGPGTGKSHTVARILGLLLHTLSPDLKIALAAPTGKAAMRLRESIAASLESLPLAASIKSAIPTTACTLHRLLGIRRHSPHFRHHQANPLPWDVVLVDEASMVDLALMSKLVDALQPGSRLILLGDKDQLASVESGAVLADCIAALPDNTVILQKSYRFDPEISAFAHAVNEGDVEAAKERIQAAENREQRAGGGRVLGVSWEMAMEVILARFVHYMETVRAVRADGWPENESDAIGRLFAALNSFRVLCATRQGARGVEAINRQVEQQLAASGYSCQPGGWYPGRPVMILRNDYGLNLFNGDIGICLPDNEGPSGAFTIWFIGEDGTNLEYQPWQLPAHETVFAMTIHKSQGSEFGEVLVVLPIIDTPLLTRELIYTAVTRARTRVLLTSAEGIFQQAVTRTINRASGLREMLTSSS